MAAMTHSLKNFMLCFLQSCEPRKYSRFGALEQVSDLVFQNDSYPHPWFKTS